VLKIIEMARAKVVQRIEFSAGVIDDTIIFIFDSRVAQDELLS